MYDPKLNHSTYMYRKIVFMQTRSHPIVLPPPIHGIKRVQGMVTVGVAISIRLGFEANINKICCHVRHAIIEHLLLAT